MQIWQICTWHRVRQTAMPEWVPTDCMKSVSSTAINLVIACSQACINSCATLAVSAQTESLLVVLGEFVLRMRRYCNNLYSNEHQSCCKLIENSKLLRSMASFRGHPIAHIPFAEGVSSSCTLVLEEEN